MFWFRLFSQEIQFVPKLSNDFVLEYDTKQERIFKYLTTLKLSKIHTHATYLPCCIPITVGVNLA